MLTQVTDGLSRSIWANPFNTEFHYFTSDAFLPALPTLGLTKWALEKIQISPDFAPFWNVETDMSS
jgi:hypothetical protein